MLFVHWSRQLLHTAVFHGEATTVSHPGEKYKHFVGEEGVRFIYDIHNHPGTSETMMAYPSPADNTHAETENQYLRYFSKRPTLIYLLIRSAQLSVGDRKAAWPRWPGGSDSRRACLRSSVG